MENNKGKTLIKYQPKFKNIVVKEINEIEAKLSRSSIIRPNEISDNTLQSLGMNTKSANLANKSSEEQEVFEVVAIGPDVTQTEIGEKVLFRPGAQATSIKIEDKYYLQLGEYEILGTFL